MPKCVKQALAESDNRSVLVVCWSSFTPAPDTHSDSAVNSSCWPNPMFTLFNFFSNFSEVIFSSNYPFLVGFIC